MPSTDNITTASPRPLSIALTGGIGSGKSAAANRFRHHGVATLDADQVARQVVKPESTIFDRLVACFGEDCVDKSGQLDRDCMRDIMLSDESIRKQVEAITHPAIRTAIQNWLQQAHGTYAIIEIPLLVETESQALYDRVLLIDCPEILQIKRVMERDGRSEAEAQAVLDIQASRADRLKVAHDVISNTGTQAELQTEVDGLHEYYVALTARRMSE